MAALVGATLALGGLAAVTAAPASATTPTPTPAAGARKNATRLPFSISGAANLSVDVASGNGLFTDRLLTLPGASGAAAVSLSYNSTVFGSTVPSAVTGDVGSGWSITGFDTRLVANGDGSQSFYGPGGLTGVFAPGQVGGTFVAPPQYQADLVAVSPLCQPWVRHQDRPDQCLGGREGGFPDECDDDRGAGFAAGWVCGGRA